MVEISEIPGITGSTLELAKAAGLRTAESLTERNVQEILEALDRANRGTEIPVRLPSEASVREWKDEARRLLRATGAAGKALLAVAQEISEEDLRAAGIEVAAMPEAKVIAEAPKTTAEAPKGTGRSAGPGAREAAKAPAKKQPGAAATEGPGDRTGEAGARPARRRKKVKRRRRTSEDPAPSPSRFRELEAVKESKPPVQRRNRGMSHPDAARVRLAATITVLGLAACVLATGALIWALVMVRIYKWEFDWRISLLLLVYPLSLSLYLGIGIKARCRLCGQRLFVPKHCLKHERARRSMFGHAFAVARDAMFLAGYRCMLCGTKTRLKE